MVSPLFPSLRGIRFSRYPPRVVRPRLHSATRAARRYIARVQAAAQSVICVSIFCTYLTRTDRPFTLHIVFFRRSPPYRYRLPMLDIFESAFELFKAGHLGAVFRAESYRFGSAPVLLVALQRYMRPDLHSHRRIHLYMCFFRL